MRPTIAILGAGRVAGVLGRALRAAGYPLAAVYSRSPEPAQRLAADTGARLAGSAAGAVHGAHLVLVTTPDAAIHQVCAEVAEQGGWQPGQLVVHCSGALGREALAPAACAGAVTGGLHPIQTFAAPDAGPELLRGITYGIEADEPLRAVLLAMASDLGGRVLEVQAADRALYHAAATIVSNYTVVLFAISARLYEQIGLSGHEAAAALLPLLEGTCRSLEVFGLPRALTGPISRGDAGTVAAHLAALRSRAPEVLPLYTTLAAAALPVARARGLDEQAGTAIAALIGATP